jgi:hypothetical protein
MNELVASLLLIFLGGLALGYLIHLVTWLIARNKPDGGTVPTLTKPAPVTPDELNAWLAKYEIRGDQAAIMFGADERTVRRWRLGETEPPAVCATP